jgi:hypothetical protein
MKKIPLHCLVLMVGPTSEERTSLLSKFSPHDILSPNQIRMSLVGDENRRDVAPLVNREINHQATLKLELGERVVVDALHYRKSDRTAMTQTAQKLGVPIYYVVTDLPEEDSQDILRGDGVANVIDARNDDFSPVHKISASNLIRDITDCGFSGVIAVADIHGMVESLKGAIEWAQSRNLFMIFLGDVVDYGPHPLECVELVYGVVTRGRGVMIMGNHERKISRWLEQDAANDVRLKLSEGNRVTTDAIQHLRFDERRRFEVRFQALMHLSYQHLSAGKTLFVHGGAEPEMFEIHDHRLMGRLESIALFGEVDQNRRFLDDGKPNRIYDWVDRIPSGCQVLVGHDIRSTHMPLQIKGEVGGTAVFMDTGSGKGGRLTTADLKIRDGELVIQSFTYH